MKAFFNLFFAVLLSTLGCTAEEPQPQNADIEPFVHWLLDDGGRLEDVRFAAVAEAVSACQVLPVDASDPVDAAMLAHVQTTLDAMLLELAQPDNSIHTVGRVNEISRHVEDFLLAHLNEADGYECSIPPNASGKEQRSGYPDLRLEHSASGRVFYIDPKVYKQGSETSSFRTFYFEPKRETNKILDDASHLIVGIAHEGKVDGLWQLNAWKLVDLINFRVRLKAEFQSSNRELYQADAVLCESGTE
ncbi:hypothetical protein SH580_19150 [Coraliomargarita algicola]|uniref:Lipoprotein n=1 Tax=Coraliomargarita algicola TaxID=3092156 RepID=A0ABZ0RJ84_9BACT|nr:hypothetical protein [Coraliomargarita sp. J2-16]WPJ95538.1 hypothetical protein SH580_19150 [Coraliomargarita sp. J2-16]